MKGTEQNSNPRTAGSATHLANEAFVHNGVEIFPGEKEKCRDEKGWVMKPLYGGSWQVSTLLLCKEGVGKVQWGPQSSLTWLAASSSSDLGIRHHRGAPCASTWALEASLRDPFVVETGRLAAGSLSCNGSKQAVCDIYLPLDHSSSLET